MKYPDDFNTPAFPAGRFVAVSRFMATVVMVVFVGIVALCGMIFWAKKTQDISPFLISVDANGERWRVVMYDNQKPEVPVSYVLQESMLNKFIHDWFSISENSLINQAMWATTCSRESEICKGTATDDIDTCAIYCACSDDVFDEFKKVVLPIYSNLESEYAAIWNVQNIRTTSTSTINAGGGTWKSFVSVQTNQGNMNFIVFAKTSFDESQFPKTMGYYVAAFNAYRVN